MFISLKPTWWGRSMEGSPTIVLCMNDIQTICISSKTSEWWRKSTCLRKAIFPPVSGQAEAHSSPCTTHEKFHGSDVNAPTTGPLFLLAAFILSIERQRRFFLFSKIWGSWKLYLVSLSCVCLAVVTKPGHTAQGLQYFQILFNSLFFFRKIFSFRFCLAVCLTCVHYRLPNMSFSFRYFGVLCGRDERRAADCPRMVLPMVAEMFVYTKLQSRRNTLLDQWGFFFYQGLTEENSCNEKNKNKSLWNERYF